jgi:class 3 adenylate cyclase
MNAELQRLKGFVPQSVLLQNVHRRRVLRKKSLIASRINASLTWWERLRLTFTDGICDDVNYNDTTAMVVASGRGGYGETPFQADSDEEDGDEGDLKSTLRASVSGRGSNGGIPTPSEAAPSAPLRTRANSIISTTRPANNANVTPGVSTGTAMGGMTQGRVVGHGGMVARFAPGHGGIVDGLSARTVSVVCINAMGFHSATLRDGAARLASLAEQLTTTVVAAAAEERGVVDSFHGDHFLLTFNAASSCATHAVRAPRCALYIGQRAATSFAFIQDGFGCSALTITAGVASGPARCGALGSRDSRRFSIVGAAVPQAFALEQLVRRHEHDALWRRPVDGPYRVAVAQPLFEDLRSQFVYECVDVASLPVVRTASSNAHHLNMHLSTPDQNGPRPKAPTAMYAIGQLLDENDANDQDMEWMYAMNGPSATGGPAALRGGTTSSSQYGNSAMDAAAAGPSASDKDRAPADATELLAMMGVTVPAATASPISGAVGLGAAASMTSHLPLAENNHVYTLVAAVAAAARAYRDAAVSAAATGPNGYGVDIRSLKRSARNPSTGRQSNNGNARGGGTADDAAILPAAAKISTASSVAGMGATGIPTVAFPVGAGAASSSLLVSTSTAPGNRSNASAAAITSAVGAPRTPPRVGHASVTAIEDVPLGAAGAGAVSPVARDGNNGPLNPNHHERTGSFGAFDQAGHHSDTTGVSAPSRTSIVGVGGRRRSSAFVPGAVLEDDLMVHPGAAAATTTEMAAAARHQQQQRAGEAACATTDADEDAEEDEDDEADPDWCWTRYVPDETSRQQLLTTLRRNDPSTQPQIERIRNLLISLTK